MKLKKSVNEYLTFTRKERIGLLALLFLILIIFLLPGLINTKPNSSYTPADTSWVTAAKRLETKEITNKDSKSFSSRSDDNDYVHPYDRSETTPTLTNLFYFDPNTLNEAGWEKLGLTRKTIHIIQNYLDKGGHFYKPEDLQKIYGIHQNDYDRLIPYIKIEGTRKEDSNTGYVKKDLSKRFAYKTIDINTADTSMLIALPGIGSKLAARIVIFRDKLGGFYAIDQVGETYGLPDSTFRKIRQYLTLNEMALKKINVNTASKDEMKAHPYIKWSLANIIVEYRNQHGNFGSLAGLKNISAITDSLYTKIAPYLVL